MSNGVTLDSPVGTGKARDHALFDAELSGAVLNFRLFMRIVTWLKPYSVRLLASAILVLIASYTAVTMEIVISRVLVDYIIVGDTTSLMPDLGMIEVTVRIEEWLGISSLHRPGWSLPFSWCCLR